MFNNIVLDIVIGLVFIYLLYSLLASAVGEFIAMIFAYRHRMLEKGIEQMLDGKNYSYYWWDKAANISFWLFRLLEKISLKYLGRNNGRDIKVQPLPISKVFFKSSNITTIKRTKLNKKAKLFAANIINHPLYRRKSEDSILFKKPAYLTASAFSDILLDILGNKNLSEDTPPVLMNDIKEYANSIEENPDLKKILHIYIEQANGDVQKFKLLLEDWFDDTMNRVSGWYKRQTTKVLFIIGLILALMFNVSTIGIVHKLSVNKELREALVQNATNYTQSKKIVKAGDEKSNEIEFRKRFDYINNYYNDTIAEVNKLIGLGWGDFGYKNKYSQIIESAEKDLRRIADFTADKKTGTIRFFKENKLFVELHIPEDKDLALKMFNDYLKSKYKLEGKATFFEMASFIFYHITFMDIIGFILTALAITMGAPFWFDLLNKFVNIRAGGKKPAEDQPAPPSGTVSKTVLLNQKSDPKSFA